MLDVHNNCRNLLQREIILVMALYCTVLTIYGLAIYGYCNTLNHTVQNIVYGAN